MDQTPTHLDLFSGIGGFALAAWKAGFRTIGFCEIDKYCQKVLAKNFLPNTETERRRIKCRGVSGEDDSQRSEGASIQRPNATDQSARIHGNIFDLDGRQFEGVSLITGGFPCQPFSVAGKRRGAADDRAIWPQMFRVIREARPAWVLGENVPGIIPMELDNVLSDLEGIGYATRSFVIPACAIDARHRRDRLWVVARDISDSISKRGCSRNSERENAEDAWQQSSSQELADTNGTGLQKRERQCGSGIQRTDTIDRTGICEWLTEPDVGRVAHGIPSRVDRLKGLGNAIVPQVAYEILREIRKLI
jgi:DNA (cytosine-5)-methyltransferase 1